MNRLNEKLFKISSDVDLIYKLAFKDFVKNFGEEKIKSIKTKEDATRYIDKIDAKYKGQPFSQHDVRNVSFWEGDTSVLKNKYSVKSHIVNPCDISCGLICHSSRVCTSYYAPLDSKIVITINKAFYFVYDYIEQVKYGRSPAETLVRRLQELGNGKLIEQFGEIRIKRSIAHELSHWISDSTHNRYLYDIMNSVKVSPGSKNKLKKLLKKEKALLLTHFEIDAQVHDVLQIKRKVGNEKWNSMSFDDLLDYASNTKDSYENIKSFIGKDVAFEWKKRFLKRLNREGLLGDNMR